MDPLTHVLSGALLARATARSQRQSQQLVLPLRLRVAAGFAAAAFPDLDLALRLIDTLIYLNWHQGPTHSLAMLPAWALLLAHLFSRLTQGRYAWRMFFIPICLGIGIHIVGDLINSYGLMLLAPFSTQRFSLPLAFVIDLWFTAIVVAGLMASLIFPQQKITAICALIGLTGYVVFLWSLHERALNMGINHAMTQGMIHAEVNVLPQPLSPFNWKIIIRSGDVYQIAHVNLWYLEGNQQFDTNAWLLRKMAAAYQPAMQVSWQNLNQFGDHTSEAAFAREAWHQPAFTQFRQFASFPLLDRIDQTENGLCAWFLDLRFKFPELPPSFRYGICRKGNESEWRMHRQQDVFFLPRNLKVSLCL